MGTQVRFWMDAYRNEAKSREAGMPVFDTVPWCEIRITGERDTVIGPVHELGADTRFPDAWAHWQRDHSTEGIVGTPLEQVAWLAKGDVETLRYAGVRTVEALASITDGSLGTIPGGISLREKARAMVKSAKEAAPLQAMSEELAKRDTEIATLKAQISDILSAKRQEAQESQRQEQRRR